MNLRSVLDRLWELQSLLTQLSEKEQALNEKPEDFAEVDREYESARLALEALNTRLENSRKERRKLETSLADQQEILKKYQGQLMQVKNQQQYAAAWKEIDTTRKTVKEIEEQLLKQMTEGEEAERELQTKQEESAPLKARWDEAYNAWQSSLGGLRKDIEALTAKAKEAESGIPDRLRNEFHRIYKQRQGIAVTVVSDNACSACRVRIRPQAMQQLKRGEMITCESCRRILYPGGTES